MRRSAFFWLVAFLVMSHGVPAGRAADDVPLPDDIRFATPDVSVTPELSRFIGRWSGAWDTGLAHLLVVESVEPNGAARVVYAWGDFAAYRLTRGWTRTSGRISGNRLALEPFRNGANVDYEFRDDGTLRGLYSRGNAPSRSSMKRAAGS